MTLAHYLALSAALFLIGLFGALTRRNIIGILMGIELMFNAANINLAAFNRFLHPEGIVGSAVALFVIAVAAAEIVVGLALVLAIYRSQNTVYAEDISLLKG
ncbi:MAG: NADH-quinone oxidoreductase subunit NuoK [Elusimicrobia bacterium]|nr:NADH-quinone oxidoreductase subunit NuoK [Elusimicrobiota bacterium]